MITVFLQGFAELLKKPLLLLPCVFSAVIIIGILFLADTAITTFFFDLLVGNIVPNGTIANLPFLIYSMYSGQLNIIAIAVFAAVFFGNWLSFCIARFAKEKKGIKPAIAFACANIANIFFLTIFQGIIFGFFIALFLAVLQAIEINEIFGLLFGLFFIIGALLVYLVFCFLPAIIAVNEMTIKEALKESGSFIKKKPLQAIVFIILLGIIFSLISNIGAQLGEIFGSTDDLLFFLLEFAFLLVAMAYAGITVPLYYLSAKEK